VLVLDHENRIMLVNQTAVSALKLPDLPIIGQPIINVLDNIELLGMLEVCGQSISNRTEVIAEDGRVFNAILTPIPEVGIAMTFHDVTYLKKLDRIKSEFVSTVSHDLRSPLTAIMGYVELIDRAGPVTELQLEFIHRVQASVQNITNLVNDLVNLGRIEAGFDERKELINLQQIINLSIENFQKQINNKHLKILVDIKGRPELQGNPIQIRQMIDHLMDNAIKYSSPESDISIQAISEQNQIIFQITDTGCGIPPVDLPFIFDKFYRSGNISSEIPGTGLGLAIVKSIVEKHLGRIWVDSALNVGSTFTIVLPANQ
jgi:two-component system NtrC family sensor kinase